MNLYEQYWWKTIINNKIENHEFFQYLTPNILTERFEQEPLTQELLTAFLDFHIKRINQINFSNSNLKFGLLAPCPPWDSYNLEVSLNKNNSLNMKASTLIHECIHGIYRVRSHDSIEPLIELEELKFFNAHKDFSMLTFEKYSRKYAYPN